jgi:hypothetical protein
MHADSRGLRAEVAKRRRVYEERFGDVRDKIFAHKELSDRDEMNALLAGATIDELNSLFGFLHALHEALWGLLVNGRRPISSCRLGRARRATTTRRARPWRTTWRLFLTG